MERRPLADLRAVDDDEARATDHRARRAGRLAARELRGIHRGRHVASILECHFPLPLLLEAWSRLKQRRPILARDPIRHLPGCSAASDAGRGLCASVFSHFRESAACPLRQTSSAVPSRLQERRPLVAHGSPTAARPSCVSWPLGAGAFTAGWGARERVMRPDPRSRRTRTARAPSSPGPSSPPSRGTSAC